jgi:hypothetical protein
MWAKGIEWLDGAKYCMHIYVNRKMRPVEIYPVMRKGE